MFDENFSFLSSTSTSHHRLADDCTNTDISPFTSRSSSPRPQSTSQPLPRRDSRFDTYRALRHPSITALTAQLESHVLTANTSVPVSPSATTSDNENDEGFFDGSETPSSMSDYSSDFDSFYDSSMAAMNPTSSPRPSLSLEAQALSSYTQRRRQRQALVRLQCLAKRAPDLAILLEECHPSSLPLPGEPAWVGGNVTSRSSSTSSLSLGRVEKDRWASVKKMPRIRKRMTR